MKASRLLSLYPQKWRGRYGDEMAAILGDERLGVRLAIDLLGGALDAHLHPELAGPILAAAGGGTMRTPSGQPVLWLRLLLSAVLVVFLIYGGLYVYRSRSPAVPEVSLSTALGEVQAGRVKSVVVVGTRATITLTDGSTQQATTLDRDVMLSDAVREHNQADPAHPTALRIGPADAFDPSGLLGAIGVLLPILVTVGLVFAAALLVSGGSRRRRYESLTLIAELRDRGVLTEDEFQREKRRLLG